MKGGNIIEIKIIGSNSKNGIKLKKEVKRAINDIDFGVTFIEENDNDRARYGIKDIPALVINDKLTSCGKVLTAREISKIISNSYS